MKKWIKGFTVAGIVLLCAGTGVTAFAGAGGGMNLMREHGAVMPGIMFNRLWHSMGNSWRDNYHDDYDDYDDDHDDYDDIYDDDHDDYDDIHDGDFLDFLKELPPEDSVKDMVPKGTYTGVEELEVEGNFAALRVVENPELTDQVAVYLKEEKDCGLRLEKGAEKGKLKVEYYGGREKGWNAAKNCAKGIIEIPPGYIFRKAEFSAEAGIISISMINAEKLELSADAGELEATGNVTRELKAEADAGEVKLRLQGEQTDFNYTISADLGTVHVGPDSYSGMSMEKEIHNGAVKYAELESNVGNVKVDFIR